MAGDTASIWTLQEENADLSIARPRDHFYTNGLSAGWTSPTGELPAWLAAFGHAIWGDGQQRVSLDLSQQIYNPVDTQASVPDPHDRPYAGLLMGNVSMLSDTSGSRDVLSLSLGVLGPWAGGRPVQNGFHHFIGHDGVKGWGYQIPNTPEANILAERTWRLPIDLVTGLEADALPVLTDAAGSVRDYAQAGVTLRLGQGLASDFGVPRIRPGLSGGDAFIPVRPLAWYGFLGVDGQAVAYDALLQAGPFRAGPHVTPYWDVTEVQTGFAVMVSGIRLTFAYVAQTPELHGQVGGMHQFVSASVSLRF